MSAKASSRIAIISAVAMGLSACAADDPNRRAKTGAAIGALVGAVAGHQVDGDKGRYVGAVVGAIAGGAAGNYMDKQAAEMERKLAAEAAREELRITRMAGDALRVGVASDATFAFGKDNIRSEALATYAKIAAVLKDYDKTVVHIVGHTDSVGTDSYNQGLSERRASAVASYLMQQGLPADRIRQEGRGEREPIASNDADSGRSKNRRVDIVIKPVIEGQEQQAWAPPPYLGA